MTCRIANKDVWVEGTFPRIAKLVAEYVEWVDNPHQFVVQMRAESVSADIFSFIQKGIAERSPRYRFYHEWDQLAVLQITTYEAWWKNQIKTQERNRIRKARKSNVELRLLSLDHKLMEQIKELYDESPLRQGQPLVYYNQSLEHLWKDHGRFLERSQFIGAFHDEELIGFAKLVHGGEISNIVKLIAKIGHRDKAPSNALLAKAVEVCADRGVRYLGYSTWGRRGLGDFKRNHAFVPFALPRYYIPLNLKGKLALSLGMHKRVSEILPPKLIDAAAAWRAKLNSWRFAKR